MVKDYGFDEMDVQFYMMDIEGREISTRKNRHWFYVDDIENPMDYDISYSILVDGKEFMKFPKDVTLETVWNFIEMQFEKDEEATEEIEEMEAISRSEREFGC